MLRTTGIVHVFYLTKYQLQEFIYKIVPKLYYWWIAKSFGWKLFTLSQWFSTFLSSRPTNLMEKNCGTLQSKMGPK